METSPGEDMATAAGGGSKEEEYWRRRQRRAQLVSDDALSSYYACKHDIRVLAATWNVGNAIPDSNLAPLLPLEAVDWPDVVAVAVQECGYTPKGEFKSCGDDWLAILIRHMGPKYTLLKYHSLWEIRLAVFCRNKHTPFITDIRTYTEATGVGNMLGNKGAVVVSLSFLHTTFCFVSSHLAAHQQKAAERNANVVDIIKNVHAGPAANTDLIQVS